MKPLYKDIYRKAAQIRKLSESLGGVDITFEALKTDQHNRWHNPELPPNPALIPITKANYELKDLLLEVRPPQWLIKTHYDDTIAALNNLNILNTPERSEQWAVMDENTASRRSQIIDEAVRLIGQGMGLKKPARFGQYRQRGGYGMEMVAMPEDYQIWPNICVGEKEASQQTNVSSIGAFEQHIPLLCHEFTHAKQIQILDDPKTPNCDYIELLRFQIYSRFAFLKGSTCSIGSVYIQPEPAFYLFSINTFKNGYNSLPQEMGADYSQVIAVQKLSKVLGTTNIIRGGHFDKLLKWPQYPKNTKEDSSLKTFS